MGVTLDVTMDVTSIIFIITRVISTVTSVRGQVRGTGGARAQEYLVQVHSSGIGLGAGWVTRDALAQSGTDRSPRKGGTCWRGYGTARSHRGGQVELDIGDLEDVDEEAPFQSALKVTA